MSEQQENPAPSDESTAQPDAAPRAEPAPNSRASSGMLQLWIKVGGWLVVCVGFMTIIGTFRIWFGREVSMPFLIFAGLLLMAASYVLAGLAFSEGRAWAIPLTILACINFTPFAFGLSLLAALALLGLSISALSEGALEQGADEKAYQAFGLWLGGLALIMLHWVLHAPWWG